MRTCELTAASSVHIASAVSGQLGVNMIDRGRVGQRPLCRGQLDNENTRLSQTNDRKGRCPVGRGGRYGSFDCTRLCFLKYQQHIHTPCELVKKTCLF